MLLWLCLFFECVEVYLSVFVVSSTYIHVYVYVEYTTGVCVQICIYTYTYIYICMLYYSAHFVCLFSIHSWFAFSCPLVFVCFFSAIILCFLIILL